MTAWNEIPIVFTCGSEQMLGILHRPSGDAAVVRAGLLVVVGGPQYRVGSHRQFTLMARGLAAAGIPVFRFDYRGLGDSDGDARTFMSIGEDIRAAIDAFCAAVPGLEKVALWGLCDAASAILMNGASEPRVAGMVLVNPESRTTETEAQAYVRHYYLGRVLQGSFWRKVLSGEVNVFAAAGGLLSTLRKAFVRSDAKPQTESLSYVEQMLRGFEAFRGPVLLLLSGRDLTARAFELLPAASPKWKQLVGAGRVRLVRLDDADHTFSSREALDAGTAAAARWVREVLG